MEIGVSASCTDETLRPDEVAVLVEQAGFDVLQFGEHTHMPVLDNAEMPRDWARLYDLLVALNTAALATTRLRVSSGIIQLGHREPITTAKALASIDQLSGGRLDLVVGHGAIPEQMRNHGVDPRDTLRRGPRAHARGARDLAKSRGDLPRQVRRVRPRPVLAQTAVQPGGVPMFFGGNSPGSEDRACEYGDGWAPLALDGTPERIRAFTAGGAGQPVVAVGLPTDPAVVDEYANAGADRIVFRLASTERDEIEAAPQEVRACVAAVVG